ncbi:histidine kinase/DNA gyrase B/HSP90-like ATPase [Nitrospirillum amazonense]|uniref:histidine kinase n=1 Tax=Nitrospirillum amazonense TaxID=28077 RepID=A0A560EHF0_9PROT|nr:HAMP domain-containing sensor histidine kinase [Nitrospirillum amazonense]TWB08799.1 histidine kinase/DNA gyrase B/HSP90-like ATPase [Nitrospirillum amazonense]
MPTVLIVFFIMKILNAGISALIWNAYRHLNGVRTIAAGFIVGAGASITGLLYKPGTDFLTGMTGFSTAVLTNAAQSICINGAIIFLGEPSRKWLVPVCITATVIYWPLILYVNATDGALRALAGAVITTVAHGAVIPVLWRQRGHWSWLRQTLLPFIIFHLCLQDGWALYRIGRRLAGMVDPTMFFPWTVIEAGMAHHLWFACFLAMLGSRLRLDVQQRNRELALEIDRRRHLEQQLAATLAAEREINAEHQQLLDVLVHEIRTPLTGIDRATEMLEILLPSVPDATRKRLTSVRDGVHRVMDLVDRIVAGKRGQRPAPVVADLEWPQVLHTVLEGLSHMDAEQRVRTLPSQQPLVFSADRDMIIAVLRNLVENALKYSPAGENVTITAERNFREVSIQIIDRGIGIPEMERESIGQRFYRASNARHQQGFGLGLFIVRRMLSQAGGTLRHGPGPANAGTVATVILPQDASATTPFHLWH